MSFPGVRQARVVLSVCVVAALPLLSACIVVKQDSSASSATTGAAAPTSGTTQDATENGTGGSTDDSTAGATDGTEESPTPGPVQGGSVDPDDPNGVAKAFGITLLDPVEAGMAEFGIVGFSSPSGRIHCSMQDKNDENPGDARCDITEQTWKAPKKPADCDLDWGQSLYLQKGDGKAVFICVGDAAGGPESLPYGRGILLGDILCISRESGMSCLTVDGSNHGFELSRAKYRVY